MCEPAHSIVQYPENFSDVDLPFEDTLDKEIRLKAGLGPAFKWCNKVDGYYHFSRFGAGHSLAIPIPVNNYRYLPIPTYYEGIWWEKRVVFDDGSPNGSMPAAVKYHNLSVMGNISLLRRFLETSISKSRYAYLYAEVLIDAVFSRKGRDAIHAKVKKVFGNNIDIHYLFSDRGHIKNKAMKIFLGATRHQDFLQPQFGDLFTG